MDKGTWTVFKGGKGVESSDFNHDVLLEISGDFSDAAERLEYAEWLAAKLNSEQGANTGGKPPGRGQTV